MAGRGAGATFTSEVDRQQNSPVHLFEAYFDAATLYETDCARPLSFGGNTYRAVGNLLQYEAIEESTDVQVHECRVTLSGVNDEWVALVGPASDYIDRRIIIRKGFLDDQGRLIAAATVVIFDGRMDAPTIQFDPETGRYVVMVTATSQLAVLTRVTGRRTNHQDAQIHAPGDTFFLYSHEGSRQLVWGRV